jgi:hypothetical protein
MAQAAQEAARRCIAGRDSDDHVAQPRLGCRVLHSMLAEIFMLRLEAISRASPPPVLDSTVALGRDGR